MHPLAMLAKEAVEEYIRDHRTIRPPGDLDRELLEKAGVFVCIKKKGQLRGCIGTFAPVTGSVAEETIRNAVAAALEDTRFRVVTEGELPELEYTVDVLSPPEKVDDLSQLDPKRFGVIVSSGGRRGLLLPDLDGVDTVEDQITIARMKAGIGAAEDIEVCRFTVRRYH